MQIALYYYYYSNTEHLLNKIVYLFLFAKLAPTLILKLIIVLLISYHY